MGGICGLVFRDSGERVIPAHCRSMLGALKMSGPNRESVAELGRLMMGALSGSRYLGGIAEMPFHGHQLAMALYGNLYNLKDLMSTDESSDCVEQVLGLYAKEGLKFVERLRGDFVLALWDGSCETLYLVTDRFRVHPLFYAHDGNKLIFASRLKGLLCSSLLKKKSLNPEAIVDVVGSSVIPTPKTVFLEIEKLPPGHVLTYHAGNLQTAPYWDIDFRHSNGANETELIRQLKDNFCEAVSIRLKADTADEIGTFLSGGVDSSTVTGVLTQIGRRPVKSFSIGFADEHFNEISYARIAAKTFAAEHHEFFVTPKDVLSAIPILLDSFDEPFANASAVPTYYCAKMAKEHGVDILYAGDGGDELFAGNERYATQCLFDYYQRITPWLRDSLLTPLVFTLAEASKWELLVKAQKYINRSSVPYPERLYSYGFLKTIEMTEWFDDGLLSALGKDFSPYAETSSYYFRAKAQSELDRQLYIDLKLTISDNDLVKVTRMTEAAGVAVRYPFLDHRLAEFAARIPASMKMRGLKLRSFFKKAYADLLPQEIRSKTKHGFGLPIPVWLRTDNNLNEMMHDLVLGRRSIQRGYFRKKAIEDLVERHRIDETTSFHGTILWNLMFLELWHRAVVDNGPAGN